MSTPPSSDSFITGYVAPTSPPQNSAPQEDETPAAPRPRRWPLLLTGFVAGAAAATVVAVIIGVTSAPAEGAPAAAPSAGTSGATSASSAGGTTSQAAASPRAQGEVGDRMTDGGITLTVTKAEFVPEIMVSDNAGSTQAVYTPQQPGDGAHFYAVTAHVVNDGQKSIVLCGGAISNYLIDDRGRKFDAIDSLYKLQGNYPCTNNIQPGFEGDATYVYRVPESAEITSWSFADAADPSSYSRPGTIVQVG
jgi:hypothetical protein